MNMFKRAKTVYIQKNENGEVRVLSLDSNGDGQESAYMNKLGYEQGDRLNDGETAELFRKLEARGLEVNIQRT